jgi:hypothetical protein
MYTPFVGAVSGFLLMISCPGLIKHKRKKKIVSFFRPHKNGFERLSDTFREQSRPK